MGCGEVVGAIPPDDERRGQRLRRTSHATNRTRTASHRISFSLRTDGGGPTRAGAGAGDRSTGAAAGGSFASAGDDRVTKFRVSGS